jgi:hypothetical protein
LIGEKWMVKTEFSGGSAVGRAFVRLGGAQAREAEEDEGGREE